LTDRRAAKAGDAQLNLLTGLGPDGILKQFEMIGAPARQFELPYLVMPAHHDVRPKNVFPRRLHATLAAAAEKGLSFGLQY
jgi:uncharacterized protein